jgi:predicted translin family RNA/ssDNA-binding protein
MAPLDDLHLKEAVESVLQKKDELREDIYGLRREIVSHRTRPIREHIKRRLGRLCEK